MTLTMVSLVFQLGILVLGAFFLGRLFERFKLPRIVGEITAGILLGPHLLGAVSLPGFANGIFPLAEGAISVSPELYGFATLASILLLFNAGLETDLGLFKKYALRGGVIGILEVTFDFVLGNSLTVLVLGVAPWHPSALIMGVILTATSVGVSARNLMDARKMDSPEGVTIMATAVFDDVLGIIVLAVVLGVLTAQANAEALSLTNITFISLRAIGVWLGFTIVGIIASPVIGRFFKRFKTPSAFMLLGLGFALLLSGLFERAGLAMIIGAYVMGLTLSASDVGVAIQESIKKLRDFLVPLFFGIMGMLVDPSSLFSLPVLGFGLIYTLAAIVGKVFGSGIPSLFLGFNLKGAARIGFGMVPRGEVALIVAGLGISSGFLDKELLGVVVFMSLITIIVSTFAVQKAFSLPGIGLRKPDTDAELLETKIPVDKILGQALVQSLLPLFEHEGFYAHRIEAQEVRYVFRREKIAISLYVDEKSLLFKSEQKDMPFIKTLMYETLLELNTISHALKRAVKPELLADEMSDINARQGIDFQKALLPISVSLELQGQSKDLILQELIELLCRNPRVINRKSVADALLARENIMSTGLQNGIAMPHCRSSGVKDLVMAVGIKKEGLDFESLDGQTSHIFVAIVSPQENSGPHLQCMAAVAGLLKQEQNQEILLNARNVGQIVDVFCKSQKKRRYRLF